MKDVKPTSLLKDRHRETEGNPDFSTKDLGVTQANAVNDGNAGAISALNQVDLQPEITNSVLSSGHVNALSQVLPLLLCLCSVISGSICSSHV